VSVVEARELIDAVVAEKQAGSRNEMAAELACPIMKILTRETCLPGRTYYCFLIRAGDPILLQKAVIDESGASTANRQVKW
jgi:hypothetical protein